MDRRRRLVQPGLLVLLVVLLGYFPSSVEGVAAAERSPADIPWPLEMLADADLADVFFVDPLRGWAVGDRGVIWHTDDGGRRWQLQSSGVGCRLASIWFADAQHGWIVGGRAHPYTHGSTGVVLRTRDGGTNWERIEGLLLPALDLVRFADAARGWAVGASSSLYGAGLFRTRDGGRSWTRVPAGEEARWQSADFRDPDRGLLADATGQIAVLDGRQLRRAQLPDAAGRPVRRIVSGPEAAFAVGERGLVWRSLDGGAGWLSVAERMPDGRAAAFDCAALAHHGAHCWVAGDPGSRVFYSADYGTTWQAFATGRTAPLHGLCFVDAHRGWAVGALGTILATNDGGRTWTLCRAGGERLGLLGVVGDAAELPLEVFASACGGEGLLGRALVLGDSTPTDDMWPHRASAERRVRQALVDVGAGGVQLENMLPLPAAELHFPAEALLAQWNRGHDGQGLRQAVERVACCLRTWRPDVVLTHHAASTPHDAVPSAVQRVVLDAVQLAAEAGPLEDRWRAVGLEPWRVKKVVGVGAVAGAASHLATAQLALPLGRSLAELTTASRGLIESRYRTSPPVIGLHLLGGQPGHGDSRRIFGDIPRPESAGSRRELVAAAEANLQQFRQRAQQRRNAEALLARAGEAAQGSAAWLAHVSQLTQGLDDTSAGDVIYQLARQFQDSGQAELADETLRLLVREQAGHWLTGPALVWQLQYRASAEMGWWRQRRQRVVAGRLSSAAPAAGAAAPAVDVQAIYQEPLTPIGQAAAVDPPAGPATAGSDAAAAGLPGSDPLALGKRIQTQWPGLFAEPEIRFPWAAAHRSRQQPRVAQSIYQNIAAAHPAAAWRACARGEIWLAEPQGPPPRPVARCPRVAQRPYLDGRLDDDVWTMAEPVAVTSVDGQQPSAAGQVRLAHDEQFLYIAVRSAKVSGVRYGPGNGPRQRDADLSRQDRVEVLLDTDRDYATWWRLTLDHRGWTGDACGEDRSWDPTWYVASVSSAADWTVEAAIAWEELAERPPRSGDVWALGLQRVIPGADFHSWTRPASPEVWPAGFGWLMFPGQP